MNMKMTQNSTELAIISALLTRVINQEYKNTNRNITDIPYSASKESHLFSENACALGKKLATSNEPIPNIGDSLYI